MAVQTAAYGKAAYGWALKRGAKPKTLKEARYDHARIHCGIIAL
jgi:hypothetical protein